MGCIWNTLCVKYKVCTETSTTNGCDLESDMHRSIQSPPIPRHFLFFPRPRTVPRNYRESRAVPGSVVLDQFRDEVMITSPLPHQCTMRPQQSNSLLLYHMLLPVSVPSLWMHLAKSVIIHVSKQIFPVTCDLPATMSTPDLRRDTWKA